MNGQESPLVGEQEATLRYFIDTVEVSEAVAKRAEARGAARVARAGSGVVPVDLRAPGETEADYLRPWVVLLTSPAQSGAGQ